MSQTSFDPQAMRDSANRIKEIMADDSAFVALEDGAPTCGSFPTAEWLHGRVNDRVMALHQQGQLLKAAFTDICQGLHTVADQLENKDVDNSVQVTQAVNDMKSNISADQSSIGADPQASEVDSGADSGDDSDKDTNSDADSGSGDQEEPSDYNTNEAYRYNRG